MISALDACSNYDEHISFEISRRNIAVAGCFLGTLDEFIEAIEYKYCETYDDDVDESWQFDSVETGTAYIAKVKAAIKELENGKH